MFAIYIHKFTTYAHSQNSVAAVEILRLSIYSRSISQMITKTAPISTKIIKSYAMKGDLFFLFIIQGKKMHKQSWYSVKSLNKM